jgi:murein DD-endopeptidase MepM/ murein hydrolase activator NlpD
VIRDLETNIHELDQYLLDKESFLRSTPTVLPSNGWITSYFGPRFSPFAGSLKMHEGLDIGARVGTTVIAPADGIVTFAGEKSGFGKFVQIDHGYGLETIFGHASSVLVHNGQRITRGQNIARVGNTGRSTGPHLHYEVRVNGTAVDPLYFILD